MQMTGNLLKYLCVRNYQNRLRFDKDHIAQLE